MDTKTMTIAEFLALPNAQQCSMENISKLSVDDLLSLLNEYNVTIEVMDKINNYLKIVRPDFIPESEIIEDNIVKEGITYPALHTIAIIYFILGLAIIIGGIILAIYFFSKGSEIDGVVIIVTSAILAISIFAISELIKVIIDISSFLGRILVYCKKCSRYFANK